MSLFERVDTVCLTVRDIEKAKQWYSEMLNLEIIFQESNYAVLSPGNSSIPLTIEEGEVAPRNSIYPIFYTTNIEETHKGLSERSEVNRNCERGFKYIFRYF